MMMVERDCVKFNGKDSNFFAEYKIIFSYD
jgi:hypothetical protein